MKITITEKISSEDRYQILVWQDTLILTFRELKAEIPSKSKSPQQTIHSMWRWDNVVPRSLKKEIMEAPLEWTKELRTRYLFPRIRSLLPSSKHIFYKNCH